MILLNVSGLNINTKADTVRLNKKLRPDYMLLTRVYFEHKILKVKKNEKYKP